MLTIKPKRMVPPPSGNSRRQQHSEPEPPHPSVAEGGERFGVDVRDRPTIGILCKFAAVTSAWRPRSHAEPRMREMTDAPEPINVPIIFRNVYIKSTRSGSKTGLVLDRIFCYVSSKKQKSMLPCFRYSRWSRQQWTDITECPPLHERGTRSYCFFIREKAARKIFAAQRSQPIEKSQFGGAIQANESQ